MSFLIDLRDYLIADAAISADVGANRIYPDQIAQNAVLPAIVIEVLDDPPETDMDTTLAQAETSRAFVQITSWAETRITADALAIKVRDRLHRLLGTIGTGSTQVRGAIEVGKRSLFDEKIEPPRFGVEQDYDIWHLE